MRHTKKTSEANKVKLKLLCSIHQNNMMIFFSKASSISLRPDEGRSSFVDGWGSKIGNVEDKRQLKEIISTELKKPENNGDPETF